MRKKARIALICFILPLLLPLCVYSTESFGITIAYSQSELPVEIYHIADIDCQLVDHFKNYPIDITSIKSQEEWSVIADTLEAYIIADSIKPEYKGVTDSEGKVSFEGLSEGLYLTMSVKAESEENILIYDSFITVVTEDMTINPKHSIIAKPNTSELKIIKQWKDEGYRENRPDRITVDIYRDTELYETRYLTAEDNWALTLELPDASSDWRVVERNVGDKYTVTFSEYDNSIIITNSYKGSSSYPDAPQTSDPLVTWPYIISLTLSGLCIIFVAVISRRKKS